MENCNELQKQISFTKLKGVCETIFNLQRKVKHLTGNELYQTGTGCGSSGTVLFWICHEKE